MGMNKEFERFIRNMPKEDQPWLWPQQPRSGTWIWGALTLVSLLTAVALWQVLR